MISSFNISLTGLNAASKRLEVSASNVANHSSTSTVVDGQEVNKPYAAKRVDQVSNALGGVETRVRDKDPATVKTFNPNSPNADANGAAETPNVSLEEEAINQIAATYDYKANLKAITVANELQKNLLDIKSLFFMTVATFEALTLPRKENAAAPIGSYRIYKTAADYIIVAAPTALEALEKCGVEKVFKIERDILSTNNVLDPLASAKALLGEKQPSGEPAVAAAPSENTAA